MAKAKSKATVMVADGSGGMMQVQDRRFQPPGDWPIRFEVAPEFADTWLRYFYAECARRGWSSGGIGQLEARENSGSVTVNTSTGSQLALVWERRRAGPLKVRARPEGTQAFPLTEAQQFLDQVTQRCQSRATERVYRRGLLYYEGLAWRGELWLDDTLRLGPPSVQYDRALWGPRVIVIDALVDCVGPGDPPYAFDQRLRELATFLSVVLEKSVRLDETRQAWTFSAGLADCAVRSLGYFEPANPDQLPTRGTARPVPLRPVSRPDFSLRGIDGTTNELAAPSDIGELWARFCALSPDRRRNFLQAAAKWQESLTHWGKQPTLSFALMVVACEALKPPDPEFRDHNVYQVVEALLGKAAADRLQEQGFRAQEVRSAHLHRGEFRSSEFILDLMASTYHDPTFDQAHRALADITQAAIIEWVRQGGTFSLPVRKQKKTWRRCVKDHFLAALLAGMTGAAAGGAVVGWLLRVVWNG